MNEPPKPTLGRGIMRRHGVHPDDEDLRKSRPDKSTRRNRAGEEFHTYVDPDLWPATARADETLWRGEHPDG